MSKQLFENVCVFFMEQLGTGKDQLMKEIPDLQSRLEKVVDELKKISASMHLAPEQEIVITQEDNWMQYYVRSPIMRTVSNGFPGIIITDVCYFIGVGPDGELQEHYDFGSDLKKGAQTITLKDLGL